MVVRQLIEHRPGKDAAGPRRVFPLLIDDLKSPRSGQPGPDVPGPKTGPPTPSFTRKTRRARMQQAIWRRSRHSLGMSQFTDAQPSTPRLGLPRLPAGPASA